MWDWYNRPGGRARVSMKTAVLIVIGLSVLVGVVFMTLYVLLAPVIFTRVPA
jgi:hypothetical protein